MIYVTRLNHTSVALNSDLIEHIEATPDTVITMTTGQRITVLETSAALIDAIREWRRSLLFPDHLIEARPEMSELPIAGLAYSTDDSEVHTYHGGI
jgi:flagellar protein FlbD